MKISDIRFIWRLQDNYTLKRNPENIKVNLEIAWQTSQKKLNDSKYGKACMVLLKELNM